MMAKEMTWFDEEIQNSLIFNTRKNPVALVLLWDFSDNIVKSLSELGHNPFGVIANMRTWNGIGWVLRGLWQMNYIEEVVVWGSDKLKTGDAFIEIMKNGTNEDFTINGFKQPLNKDFIDVESLNELRSLIKVTDGRGKNIKDVSASYPLRSKIKEPNREKRDFSSLVVPDSIILPSRKISFHSYAEDIFWGYMEVLNFVSCLGTIRKTRKKEGIVHLFNISVTFSVSQEEVIHPGFGMSKEDVDYYYKLNFSPVEDDEHLASNEYLYSDRIFRYSGDRELLKDINWQGFNQLDQCVENLKKSPESKRSSVVLLGPTDLSQMEDAPCFVFFTLSIIEEALYGSYVFRSHDIYRGWPSNLLAISRLHREVAKRLEIESGFLSINSHNAQIYERDLSDALALLDKYYYNLDRRRDFMKFKPDPAGNFVFSIDSNTKEVTTKLVDETGFLAEYSHKDPEVLVNFIAVSFPWLDPQHIVYLGKEMEKIKRSLEAGEEYIQG